MGGFVVAAVFGEVFAATVAGSVIAFAINMVASSIISKIFAPDLPNAGAQAAQPNPGNRQQLSPAGDNKLPVVYGTAYLGGIITDLSISDDNQDIYWVMSLCEVTNTQSGVSVGAPDTITFGDVYWGGKKCVFSTTAGETYKVTGLLDESTGETQDVGGYMDIYLYSNGSGSPANSAENAINLLSADNLIYKWDSNKIMENCAFAIVHLKYNQDRNLVSLNQTRFQITNSRTNTGDCFYDYFTNERYGAAIPPARIDTTSLAELTAYSNQIVAYNNGTGSQPRFKFNGSLDTNLKIMQNIQSMADSCDCLVRYSEIYAKWGVIVQSPIYSVSMDLNDSNIISAITVTPIDLSNSFNIIECKFPDGSQKDSFNTSTLDLSVVNPSLMFPNEPVNKQSVNLYLVNNSVTAQQIANRMLEAAREDLQIMLDINYVGLQLEAGDIVTVTNANYGWVAKLFRITKVIQKFTDDGKVYATLNLSEYNPSVYDDKNVTEYQPAPNTGIGSPITFGTIPTPVISSEQPYANSPSVAIEVTTSSAGITQYAEVWYSAYQYPTQNQRIFAGTTAIKSNGNPYGLNEVMPAVQISNLSAGNWYFFTRMVNSIAKSNFSLASSVLNWRPTTFTYTERYLSVAYADDDIGTGFNLNPRNKEYYGLLNQSSNSPNLTASSYTWYRVNLTPATFGTNNFLLYTKRNGRSFTFGQGLAGYATGTASFVPTQTANFDATIWSGLPDGLNIIDLDQRTGQLIGTGTTTVGTGEIAIINNPNGSIIASLQEYLDFGGPYTKTVVPASITIDIYGRVVGFSVPDDFDYTENNFIATANQTIFNVTRGAGYIPYQCWVFKNGLLLNEDEYTDNTSNITLDVGCTLYDNIEIIAFKSVNSTSTVYASFTRNTAILTNQSVYTASGFTLNNGYELLFLNGAIVTSADYSISGQDIIFIGNVTGDLQIFQWTPNNLGVANGTPVNADAYTIIGQSLYNFNFNPSAFNLFSNGVILVNTIDYTEGTNQYTLLNTPSTIDTIMVQQTFSRTGAV
jgi:hypothetical protein